MIWRTYIDFGLATSLALCLYVGWAAKQGMFRDLAALTGMPLNPAQLAYLFAGSLVLAALLWPVIWAALFMLYDNDDGNWKG